MASPLLKTRLYIPRPRRGLVPRPRLRERLSRGAEVALTLISAPAGFGKTTLLAEWLAAAPAGERPAAWLALDASDNQPVAFWTDLIAALRTVAPELGVRALALLQTVPTPPIEAVLTTLLNDLAALASPIVLVLDDYHVIQAREVQDGLAFVLDHRPPPVQLVIASRADPVLPLARLRARGDLVEIRATDLRFTPDEAAVYLNETMGLALGAGDVAVLEGRTEGWIAALQLAALSLQGRADVAGFIAGFAGDDRHIVDFLVEEVLDRQPAPVRRFLLQTAILERLSGPLCDAVTDQAGGQARLVALERGNLFVVPLDDSRHWYRYHHLFADMLRARLHAEQPDLVPELHRRASDWYERHDGRPEAIRHALAAGDVERAADLIERALPALRRERRGGVARGWLAALPDKLIRRRPVLSVAYAWALLADGELAAVEARLRDAERWLDAMATRGARPSASSPGMVVVDEAELDRLPAAIAIYRAAQAQALGDVPATLRHAQRALDLGPADDDLWRGAAAGFLGLAAWASGDLTTAHRTFHEGLASLERAGHLTDVINGAIVLADIRIAQGRLRAAERTLEQAIQRATDAGAPLRPGTADHLIVLSELRRERHDLAGATQHLLRSQELSERTGHQHNRARWQMAMASIQAATGDLDGALDRLDEAERLVVRDFVPIMRPVSAVKTRLWLAQGRVGDALGWAREQGLSSDDALSYQREFEHLTLVRVLLAQPERDRGGRGVQAVVSFLERLLAAAERGERAGTVIEVLVLQALAQQALGTSPAALASLERALLLAEPEGYVRLFLDQGPPMVRLLQAAARQGIVPSSVRRLLRAGGPTEERRPVGPALTEPLSERERDVLRLLGSDLNGPEIARELGVSLNTLRTHTKHIYAKLGVNSRRAALRRAEELALLSRNRQS